MRKAFLLAGLILGCMSPAVASNLITPAPFVNGPPEVSLPPRADRVFGQLRSTMIDLREQAIALQASDGGTLTAEHRDFIQTRIDAAYRRYRVARRNEGSALR